MPIEFWFGTRTSSDRLESLGLFGLIDMLTCSCLWSWDWIFAQILWDCFASLSGLAMRRSRQTSYCGLVMGPPQLAVPVLAVTCQNRRAPLALFEPFRASDGSRTLLCFADLFSDRRMPCMDSEAVRHLVENQIEANRWRVGNLLAGSNRGSPAASRLGAEGVEMISSRCRKRELQLLVIPPFN